MSDDAPITFSASLPDELDGLVGAAIRSIDARRRGEPPSQEEVDTQVLGAIAEIEGRNDGREELRRFARQLADAARAANNKVVALPDRSARRRRNIHDPDVFGDAAAVTIKTRKALMKSAKPRTFVVPEKGALICSGADDTVIILGEDGCNLPTLGKDFGFNPEQSEWVDCSKKQNT